MPTRQLGAARREKTELAGQLPNHCVMKKDEEKKWLADL